MKRYKLLKDMPTIKAGTAFVSDGTHITQPDCNTMINIQDILNFNDWFEEIKEFQSFKCMTSGMVSVIRGCSGGIEEFYRSTGNCYPIDTPDETIIKEQKLIPQALHRLKMAAHGFMPDWNNPDEPKYFIYYRHRCRQFYTDCAYNYQQCSTIYYQSKEDAQWVIDNLQDELKLVMGIE